MQRRLFKKASTSRSAYPPLGRKKKLNFQPSPPNTFTLLSLNRCKRNHFPLPGRYLRLSTTRLLTSLTDPQQNLIFLTNRVGRQLSRLLLERMEFEEFLPQSTHMGLLADLITGDCQRQQDLAISTIKDKGTVARSLKQLEESGIIVRAIDKEDRRQKLIQLTEKGHRLWEYARSHSEHAMNQASKDIPPDELALCTNVLNKIYHNLHQQLSAPKIIPS